MRAPARSAMWQRCKNVTSPTGAHPGNLNSRDPSAEGSGRSELLGNTTEPAGWGRAASTDCDLLDLAQHGKQMGKKGEKSTSPPDSSRHKNLIPESKKAQLAAVLLQRVIPSSWGWQGKQSTAKGTIPRKRDLFLHIFMFLTDQHVWKEDMHTHRA